MGGGGGTKHGCQVTTATEFCKVAPNISGSSACNLLHVNLLGPRILTRLPDLWKNLCTRDVGEAASQLTEKGKYVELYPDTIP